MALTQEYLNAQLRQESYMEIMMYVPDDNIQIASVSATDILNYADIDAIKDIKKYSSTTIATLEENMWILDGRFRVIVDGRTTPGYISNSVSDENGDFQTNPTLNINLSTIYNIENFSLLLNPAVPTGYPKSINVKYYNGDTLIGTSTQNLTNLSTLPSVTFPINSENVSKLEIEFVGTRLGNRRIRLSTILFGKIISLNQNDIINTDFLDKTSYVTDTIPSRTFKFNLNNYEGFYNIDNPNNGYVNLDNQTRVMFRNGYNIAGYVLDENENLVYNTGGYPIVNNEAGIVDIAWDDWKELRLLNVYANADESATFECGSLLDSMTDKYTNERWNGNERTVEELVDDILRFQGISSDVIEWSSDGIKKPTYSNGTLLPYEQWSDTSYKDYKIKTLLPELPCRELLQLLAFSIGATILIKDNGKIKFANLDINNPSSFTNQFEFSYKNFESIPAAEQLPSISKLEDISLPKYVSSLKLNNENTQGTSQITTIQVSSVNTEITYSACSNPGVTVTDTTSGASLQSAELFARRGIITLGGLVEGNPATLTVTGYPIETETIQERNVTSDSLVLSTQLMYYDPSSYNSGGTIKQTEMIKRKYLDWYKKKFKYKITTRGEPLVNAGDYATIQTQFSSTMPVYILQNHIVFDGTWSGDMEVIALGN